MDIVHDLTGLYGKDCLAVSFHDLTDDTFFFNDPCKHFSLSLLPQADLLPEHLSFYV